MTTKVINIKNLKLNKVQFSKPKNNKNGGKVIYINYDYEDGQGPKPLRLQMPKMKSPFGISGYEQDRSDKTDNSVTEKSQDSIDFSLGDYTDTIEKLEQLDKMFIDKAKANPIEFFNKKRSNEGIDEAYSPTVKYSKNKDEYPPRMKTKIYKNTEGKYNVQVYNPDRKPVELTIYNHDQIITRGCECVTLLGVAGWVTPTGLGLSWRPAQMIVYKADNNLQDFAFIEDSDVQPVSNAMKDMSVNSNDESDDNEEPETDEVLEEVEETEDDPLEEIVETKPKNTRGRKK